MLEPFLSSISVWLLLKILALTGYTFLGVALLRRRAELVNFLVVSSVICALYVFSVTGLLLAGYWLVLIGGWVSFACASGLALRRPGIVGDLLTPGWLCFLACTIYYSYLVHDTVPLYWDEFAHWGLSAKEMLHTDALLDQSALYPNLGYPPRFPADGLLRRERGPILRAGLLHRSFHHGRFRSLDTFRDLLIRSAQLVTGPDTPVS